MAFEYVVTHIADKTYKSIVLLVEDGIGHIPVRRWFESVLCSDNFLLHVFYPNRQSVKIGGLWVFGATGSMAVSKTADRGSNPLSPALYLIYKCFGRVAQERAADINQRVNGASPSSSTF